MQFRKHLPGAKLHDFMDIFKSRKVFFLDMIEHAKERVLKQSCLNPPRNKKTLFKLASEHLIRSIENNLVKSSENNAMKEAMFKGITNKLTTLKDDSEEEGEEELEAEKEEPQATELGDPSGFMMTKVRAAFRFKLNKEAQVMQNTFLL